VRHGLDVDSHSPWDVHPGQTIESMRMNTDIRISVSFRHHRKRLKLRSILGPGSTDFLLDLWISTAMNHPSGFLDGMDEQDIALESGWMDDPKIFVDALIKCSLLDKTDNGFKLHDWEDHQRYVLGAEERSERARHAANVRYGKPSYAHSMPVACSTHTKCNAPSPSPSPSPKEKEKKVATTVSEKRNGSKPSSPIFLDDEFQWQNITDAHLSTWSQAYPACDIPSELLKSALYIRAHPHKRKRNWERYIIGWFGRAQDWGGTKGKRVDWDIDSWANEKDAGVQ